MKNTTIVCIGEILWDCLPDEKFLGGAPFNVAYHLKKFGWNVEFVSRIGDDGPGKEVLEKVSRLGMSTKNIQTDPSLPTGIVDVKLGREGVPEYTIKEPAAWDNIMLNESVKKAMHSSAAIVFGTLAQRNPVSGNTIQSIRSAAGLKVLDLNLRAPFDDPGVVKDSLEIADVLKMNEEDLQRLQNGFNLAGDMETAAASLAEMFGLQAICITCGGNGACLLYGDNWLKSEAIKIDAIDTVGAGDAFLAVLITGLLNEMPHDKLLRSANRFAAYIATQKGSTPDYNLKNINEIESLDLYTTTQIQKQI